MLLNQEESVNVNKKLQKSKSKDVDWAEYFAKIQKVCPWSYKSFMQDKILVWTNAEKRYNTISKLFNSSNHEAFVYTFTDASAEWLESQCELLNKQSVLCEWLWSHPEADSGDGNSTPVPVLIQQDRQKLNTLREKLGYTDE